jgi:diguanylate cyclase (GGDEF)-like protein/PAS domain S-box-containing protein
MPLMMTPYVLLCGVSTLIALLVAYLAWQRRNSPSAIPLTRLMLSAAIWSFGMTFDYASIEIEHKILWSKIEYLGALSLPVFFLWFALSYSRLNRWITKRNIALLFTLPILSYLITLTNEYHHLIWTSYTPVPGQSNLIIFGHGVWFWIGVIGYSYLLMFIGSALLIWNVTTLPPCYRIQAALVVFATLIPWIANISYSTGLIPIPGLEPTSITMVFSVVIILGAISYFYLLDRVPIARHTLIETMNEGMLFLDLDNQIIDVNPAVQTLLNYHSNIKPKDNAEEIFAPYDNLLEHLKNNSTEDGKFIINTNQKKFIEISLALVNDPFEGVIGKILFLRDISDQKNAEERVKIANLRLQEQLDEIQSLQAILKEQVIRDSLTGLYNRRFLDEMLEKELERAERAGYPLSILMLDIDHFKKLNDQYGHPAGDQILRALSRLLLAKVRHSDLVCRYGGEEFIIIMPNASLTSAKLRAETIVKETSQLRVSWEEYQLQITISIGVAIFPEHGQTSPEIISAADSALYTAKKIGRNRVAV